MNAVAKKVTTFYSDFEIYEILRIIAWHERRSISSQIVRMIRESLFIRREGGFLPDELLSRDYIKELELNIGKIDDANDNL